MSVRHRGTGWMTGGTAVDWPPGYTPVTNDYAIAHVVQTGDNDTITGSAGWTQLATEARSAVFISEVWGRRLQNGDSAPDFTLPGGTSGVLRAAISIFEGVDTSTALDVAITSDNSPGLDEHETADPGDTATACAAIVSFVAARSVPDIYGIEVDVETDEPIVPGSSVDPIRLYGGYGYAVSTPTELGMAGAMHHQIIPTQDDWPRTHTYRPVGGDLLSGGWIDHVVVLRPADPTIAPVAKNLRGVVRQQPLPTWGVEPSPADLHNSRLSVQVLDPYDGASADDTSTWDNFLWGEQIWYGPGRWVDITDRVRGLQWSVGSNNPGDRPRVGTITIDLDNPNGDLSTWATTGDFTNGGQSWFHTGTLLRVCWTGYNTGATVQYGRSIITAEVEQIDYQYQDAADAWVTVTAAEPIARLASYTGIEVAEEGTNEGIVPRIGRLLFTAGWPYGSWLWGPVGAIPAYASSVVLLGTTRAGERLAELYLTADSAGVQCYSHPDGGLLLNNPTAGTAVATFSNDPTGAELPVPADGMTPYSSYERILNVAIGQRVDGEELLAVAEGDSLQRFGRRDSGAGWPRTGLICTQDSTVTSIIEAAVVARGYDHYGIEAVEVDADMNPAELFYILASLRVYDNVDARWVHPTSQTVELNQEGYVEGMTHRLVRLGYQFKWTATLNLSAHPS